MSKRKAPTPEFTWLKPYLAGGSSGGNNNTATMTETARGEQKTEKIFTIDSCLEEDLLGVGIVSSSSSSPKAPPRSGTTGGVSKAPSNNPTGISTLTDKTTLSPNDINQLRIDGSPTLSGDVSGRSNFYEPSSAPIAARESHVRHQMALRESSYTHNTTLTVFIGTWNVNGVPPSIGLAGWLAVDQNPPDVYALGFQELDLATETYIFNATPKEEQWRTAVKAGVHPAAQYIEVASIRLVGMLLLVYVKAKHLNEVKNVQTHMVPTGIMNMLGNKGGVAVRMDLYNTSICFVNCHLAAHVEEYERRNEDYDCICEKTVFVANYGYPPKYIRDHNHIYFFGDMNYRIPPQDLDIRRMASTNQFKTLLSLDQLNSQRKIGRVFEGYNEGEITFRPTFKYDLNTDNWDTSEKARQPAWCDRILWAGEGISQSVYRSHMALKISDHKPVSSSFQAQIKVIDKSSFRRVHEEVMKQLDKLENEYLPQVILIIRSMYFSDLLKENDTFISISS